jgi:hypothetical protein
MAPDYQCDITFFKPAPLKAWRAGEGATAGGHVQAAKWTALPTGAKPRTWTVTAARAVVASADLARLFTVRDDQVEDDRAEGGQQGQPRRRHERTRHDAHGVLGESVPDGLRNGRRTGDLDH